MFEEIKLTCYHMITKYRAFKRILNVASIREMQESIGELRRSTCWEPTEYFRQS